MRFKIVLGDWSNDGHGGSLDVTVECTASNINPVREAFFKAKTLLPQTCHPDLLCCEYGDNCPPEEATEEIERLSGPSHGDDGLEWMARLAVWFLNIGDPSLQCSLVDDPMETLHFYGFDSQGRHIGFFGYGLFGE